MSQRKRLILALTAAFVLVLSGGVVSRLSIPARTAAAPADPGAAPLAGAPSDPRPEPGDRVESPTADAEWAALFEQRERQYRERIEEANRRIRQQQRALDEARRPVEPPPARRETEHDDDDDHHRARFARLDHDHHHRDDHDDDDD